MITGITTSVTGCMLDVTLQQNGQVVIDNNGNTVHRQNNSVGPFDLNSGTYFVGWMAIGAPGDTYTLTINDNTGKALVSVSKTMTSNQSAGAYPIIIS